MTAEQISARYIVGEQRLLDYSRRGNLAMMRRPDGVLLFDADDVASFFRPRGQAAPSMAVLGASRLGVEPTASMGAREARRRALRAASASPSAAASGRLAAAG
ncbi:hypothetical protein [Sorangium sp. So ce861]|uniref:hypothetical protein n=1 Tax=Sorangium sp. So ce861 TaxID=3133323 RepID=UPI003F63FEF1